MKTIQSVKDLIEWAEEINRGVSISRKCDMQDIYAHSQQLAIDKYFIAAEGQRRLIICSVNNTMAFEEVERLLKVLAKHHVNSLLNQEQDDLDAAWRKLAEEKNAFENAKKQIYRKITWLNETINGLAKTVDFCKKERIELSNKLAEFKEKAKKFDALKKILA
jgi:predicted RNase H-like nuclease (RuvC/YqgF family)